MKNLIHFTSMVVSILFIGCKNNNVHYETAHSTQVRNGLTINKTSITSPEGNLLVEVAGDVQFSSDLTGISKISEDGYLVYKNDEESLYAQNMDGTIEVAILIDGKETLDTAKRTRVVKRAQKAITDVDEMRKRKY